MTRTYESARERILDAAQQIILKRGMSQLSVEAVITEVGLSKGGTLMKDHIVIKVRCLPTAIPDAIEHDVSKLEIDDYVTAGQLALPSGVTLVTPANTSVCHVAKIVVQEVAAPAATPAAGEAAPAGDKPAAAGDKPAEKAAEKPAGKDKK